MSEDQLSMKQLDVLRNTQPGRFEVNRPVIDVFLAGSRALPAEDSTGRAIRIAAGLALQHTLLVATHGTTPRRPVSAFVHPGAEESR